MPLGGGSAACCLSCWCDLEKGGGGVVLTYRCLSERESEHPPPFLPWMHCWATAHQWTNNDPSFLQQNQADRRLDPNNTEWSEWLFPLPPLHTELHTNIWNPECFLMYTAPHTLYPCTFLRIFHIHIELRSLSSCRFTMKRLSQRNAWWHKQ